MSTFLILNYRVRTPFLPLLCERCGLLPSPSSSRTPYRFTRPVSTFDKIWSACVLFRPHQSPGIHPRHQRSIFSSSNRSPTGHATPSASSPRHRSPRTNRRSPKGLALPSYRTQSECLCSAAACCAGRRLPAEATITMALTNRPKYKPPPCFGSAPRHLARESEQNITHDHRSPEADEATTPNVIITDVAGLIRLHDIGEGGASCRHGDKVRRPSLHWPPTRVIASPCRARLIGQVWKRARFSLWRIELRARGHRAKCNSCRPDIPIRR